MRRIALDASSAVRDMPIQCPILNVRVGADAFEQLRPGQRLPDVGRQRVEDLELRRCQVDQFVVDA